MATLEKDIEIPIGRRASDGIIRVYQFSEDRIALTVNGLADRAPTLLLTLQQARLLKDGIENLLAESDDSES
jgi:hypothetical protein